MSDSFTLKCVHCHTNPRNVQFMPCGHVLYCDQCWGVKIYHLTCTECRAEIKRVNIPPIPNSGQKPSAQAYGQLYGQPSYHPQPSYAQQSSSYNPHPDFYNNTGRPTSSQQYLLGIGNLEALYREKQVNKWLSDRLNPYGMASSQSSKDKILAMSGKWTGSSKPYDPSKLPTKWVNTIVNFQADPENPNILTISGRGSSLFQGEEIHFHLVGTVNTKTFAFELFKTHTGRFTHTLVYKGTMDPDKPVLEGSFAVGTVKLEKIQAPLVPPGQLVPNAAPVPPAKPIQSIMTNQNREYEASWATKAMRSPNRPKYKSSNQAEKGPGSSGGSRKTRQKRSAPKKSRRTKRSTRHRR